MELISIADMNKVYIRCEKPLFVVCIIPHICNHIFIFFIRQKYHSSMMSGKVMLILLIYMDWYF